MITKNMIEAGMTAAKDISDMSLDPACYERSTPRYLVSAIYEAMTVQRQKDEKQAGRDFYDKHSHLVEGHSSR